MGRWGKGGVRKGGSSDLVGSQSEDGNLLVRTERNLGFCHEVYVHYKEKKRWTPMLSGCLGAQYKHGKK